MNQSRKLYVMLLLLLIVFYTGGCITDSIIFPAPPSSYKDSSDIIKLESENGIVISAIYLPTDKAGFTVIYSHGNAEDLGHILPYLRRYQEQGFALFSYDYRGYGTSQGKASEKSSYKDIEAAYAYLTVQLKIDPNQNYRAWPLSGQWSIHSYHSIKTCCRSYPEKCVYLCVQNCY